MKREGGDYDNVGDTLDHCMAEGMDYQQPDHIDAREATFSDEMKSWATFGESLSWRWRIVWVIATPIFVSLQLQRFLGLRLRSGDP